MKYLDDLSVERLLRNEWHRVIEAVESAFVDKTADMVPKTYMQAGEGVGDYRAMPAALKCYAALKWIGVFPKNHICELPTTLGTLLLNDRFTGQPLMAMDCTTLTAYRTAATSAIAAKYCFPKAQEFAFIGCGLQAKHHIEAYEEVYGHANMFIELYDKDEKTMKGLYHWIGEENISRGWGWNKSVEATVKQADVITTLTPSTQPYLDRKDLKKNCHINAVGADAIGKRELMPNVIDGAEHVICDAPDQASHSGELQYHVWPQLVWTLPEVIKNHKKLPLDEGISVFDSTGVAIEDVAIAILIYKLYKEHN